MTPATGYGIGIGKTPTFGRELDVNGEIYQNNNQVLDDVLGGGGIAVSGSANSRTVSLSNSGATAGTFPKVIVDTYGRVTYGYGSLLATDIPNLDTGKLTTGTLPILRGGTNSTATPTAGTVVYGNGTAQAYTTAGTAGQILASNGASAPSFTTLDMSYLPDAAFKKSVKAATTANITLSAPQTIDGISVVVGDRVLVKDQTTASQNGIYIVQTLAWTRATDADISSEIAGGVVNVDQGTANGGVLYENDFKTTDTINTTAMPWYAIVDTNRAQTLANKTMGTGSTWNGNVVAGQYGGTGVANTGKTITLGGNLTTSGASALTLTTTAATSVTLPTTGTLATLAGTESLTNKTIGAGSTWNGNAIAVNYGGTGLTSAPTAGSVIFSYGGTLNSDNTNLFWDNFKQEIGNRYGNSFFKVRC